MTRGGRKRSDRGAVRRPKDGRSEPATVFAFGTRAAREALETGAARRVLLETGSADGGVGALAERHAVAVERTDRETLDRIAGGVRHQGVAVEVPPPATLGERDLAGRAWPPDAVVVVLEGVLDPQNVGAAARVAEAAGAAALVLRERRAAGLTAAAIRASSGALLHLPVAIVANIPRALARLKDGGFLAVGLAGEASTTIYDAAPPTGPVAIVVGSEERGLSRLVREACDLLVALPMRGRVQSLNASSAVAAALYGYALRGPSVEDARRQE